MDDLDILQGAVVKIITSYPGEEVKSINKLNVESQSVVGSVFEQDALQRSGWKRTVCQVSNLSGTNSEEATERAAKAVVLAFSSLIPFRILKMSPASYSVNASRATIQSYESYGAQNYVRTMDLLEVP